MGDVDDRTRETAATLLAASKMPSRPSSGLSSFNNNASVPIRTGTGELHGFADITRPDISDSSSLNGGRGIANSWCTDGNPRYESSSLSSSTALQDTVSLNLGSHNINASTATTVDTPTPHPTQYQSVPALNSVTTNTSNYKDDMPPNLRVSLGAPTQREPHHAQHHPQHQQQGLQHHHIVDANSMLSMSSIGFGIDSSPSAALGDATAAALRAVQDAMERSTLRLPMSSHSASSLSFQQQPQQPLLQIKVNLGVPAKQDGTGEPMVVDIARLSSFLPSVIPILPIRVEVGGLYLPAENQGSPSICTAVACVTLQSQAPPVSFPAVTAPQTDGMVTRTGNDLHQHQFQQHHMQQQSQQRGTTKLANLLPHQMSNGQVHENPPPASPPSSPSAVLPDPSNMGRPPRARVSPPTVRPSISQVHQSPALTFLATAAASSPPQAHINTAGATTDSRLVAPAATEPIVDLPLQTSRLQPQLPSMHPGGNAAVRRSNSMEMLAMISEEIRLARDAAGLATLMGPGGGPATLAVQKGLFTSMAPSFASGGTEPISLTNHGVTSLIRMQQRQGSPENSDGSGGVSRDPTSDGGDDNHNNGAAMMAMSNSDEEQEALRNGGNYNYKKLPPGVTTKNNQRLFVKHRYRDYSGDQALPEELDFVNSETGTNGSSLGSRSMNAAFPVKLHETLTQIEKDGYGDIIGWLPHGRSFKIHKQKEFGEIILPRYFVMTKKSSFLRQLNLYSFNRFSAGPDQGSYYHEKFLKGLKFLCRRMTRQKVNGNRIRSAGNPDDEPNLSLFPVCPRPQAVSEPLTAFSSAAKSLSSMMGAAASIPASLNSYSLPGKDTGDGVSSATPFFDRQDVDGSINDQDDGDDDDDDDDEGSEGNYPTTTTRGAVKEMRALRTV